MPNHSDAQALQETSHRKTLTMERSVSQLRALVIGVNVTAWFLFLGPSSPRAPLAWFVIAVAVPYAIWSYFTRPYLRFPLLRLGALTLTMDAALITLWVLGTGGPQSPFWVIYFISVISVGMRYDIRQAIGASIGEAGLYLSVLTLDGPVRNIEILVRPSYIVIAGIAVGFLARQERLSREERIHFERMAVEHAELLGRERETVERLRRLDQMKTEFVASAAHELRTPLTTLSGFAITLSEHGRNLPADRFEDVLQAMRRQGQRAKALIDNLLDLSQLEYGRLQLQPVRVPLRAAVHSALETAPPPDGVEVDVAIDESDAAMADRARLEQVVTNLLTNAYRYGGPHVSFRVKHEDDAVILAVADDGEGVPDTLRAHLFQPFGRGTNAAKQPGSGLGLAISQRLVEALGGQMWYQPGDPKGSCFTISLRRAG
jgi:signal transduction histidine kinase